MLALAQRVAGNGRLRVHDSVLAGVPLTADISLGYAQAQAPTPASIRGELALGGNQLRLEGVGDPAGAGLADRLQAPAPGRSAGCAGAAGPTASGAGDLAATPGQRRWTVVVNGRWPEMRTEGDVDLQALQAGTLSLAPRAPTGAWTVRRPDLALQAEATGPDLERSARAGPACRPARHAGRPPHRPRPPCMPRRPPTAACAGRRGPPGTRPAAGAWRLAAEAVGGGRWSAQVERLDVGGWDGKAG
jgi:translocation and assembly module TamB